MQRAHFKCECCSNDKDTLEIHHRYYAKGLMVWEYPDESLVCVCHYCHERIAEAERILLRQLAIDPDTLVQMAMDIQEMKKLSDSPHQLIVDTVSKLVSDSIDAEMEKEVASVR